MSWKQHMLHFFYVFQCSLLSKWARMCWGRGYALSSYIHKATKFADFAFQSPTLPEAQWTQDIDSVSWVIFKAVEIIRGTESIPWVRCASGNVWNSISSRLASLFIKSYRQKLKSQPTFSLQPALLFAGPPTTMDRFDSADAEYSYEILQCKCMYLVTTENNWNPLLRNLLEVVKLELKLAFWKW